MPDSSDNVIVPDGASIVWGPVIRVDGKRPEWLRQRSPVKVWNAEKRRTDPIGDVGEYFWHEIESIVLPADHPHYRQPTTPELDPALWDRMVALVRELASRDGACFVGEIKHEAQAIVADLPKPVDPDLIEARKICAMKPGVNALGRCAYLDGNWDEGSDVSVALAAIKRGRELATPEVSHVG